MMMNVIHTDANAGSREDHMDGSHILRHPPPPCLPQLLPEESRPHSPGSPAARNAAREARPVGCAFRDLEGAREAQATFWSSHEDERFLSVVSRAPSP